MANNSTTSQNLESLGRDTLAQQSTASLFWIILGSTGILTNSLILITIAKTKSLHNKGHYAICGHALAETFYSLALTITGYKRYVTYLLNKSGVTTQGSCALSLIFQGIGDQAVNYAVFCLGIDRLLAVSLPIFYRSLRPWQTVLAFNLICYGMTVGNVITAFLFIDDLSFAVAVCVKATAYSKMYLQMWIMINDALTGLTVAIYVICLAKVGYRYWGTKWVNNAQKTEWAKEIQLSAFKSICIIACLHVVFFGGGLIINNMIGWGWITLETSKRFAPYLALEFFFDILSHFFIYLLTNTQFRQAFLKLARDCLKSKTEVMMLNPGI